MTELVPDWLTNPLQQIVYEYGSDAPPMRRVRTTRPATNLIPVAHDRLPEPEPEPPTLSQRSSPVSLMICGLDARGVANQPVAMEGGGTPVATAQPSATALAPARPTPFRDATVLEYALARGGAVELAIYAVDGRRIRTLERAHREAGVYRMAWDGRDERGQRTPAGMYYARLTTIDERQTRTLFRVR